FFALSIPQRQALPVGEDHRAAPVRLDDVFALGCNHLCRRQLLLNFHLFCSSLLKSRSVISQIETTVPIPCSNPLKLVISARRTPPDSAFKAASNLTAIPSFATPV